MRESDARKLVQMTAVLCWLAAVYMVVSAGLSLTIGPELFPALVTWWFFLESAVLVLLTAFFAALGVGLWRYRNWARVGLMITACVAGVGSTFLYVWDPPGVQ